MRRILIYGIMIFCFSVGIGFYYGSLWKMNHLDTSYENQLVTENIVATAFIEEKISYNADLKIKKYYKNCGHCEEKSSEIPKEMVNLSKHEIREIYKDWNIEKFNSNELVLSKEIDGICDEHYILKLGEDNIEVYKDLNSEFPSLYKSTNISRNYLTNSDIEKLEEGIYIYGIGNLNSAIEDFE